MDFKVHLEKSWKRFTGHLPALLLSTLVYLTVSIFSLGIMIPVASAGYMQSLLLTIRDDKKPEIADIFKYMNLFFPLLGFSLVVGFILILGVSALVLPGLIIGALLTFFCLYMLPLMTDQNMELMDALKESSNMAMEQPIVEHLVVVVLFVAVVSLGGSSFIGSLFTQPFATLFILSIFEERKRKQLVEPPPSPEPPPVSKESSPPPPPED